MKLLLTSQGLPEELKEVFLSLLTKPTDQIKVAFIPTAAYGEEKDPAWLQVYKDQLNSYGINDIEDVDLRNEMPATLEKKLSDKDIIFVNGGNTFYLLKYVRLSGFDKIIKKLVEQGTLYIGVSAGSYIACPTIEQSLWKRQDRDRHGVTDMSGLKMVPFIIFAHYKESYLPVIEDEVKTTKYPIIALTDTQAVLVEDGNYKIVGEGKELVFK